MHGGRRCKPSGIASALVRYGTICSGLESPRLCIHDLLDGCRYEKSYQAGFLDEVPHRRLTKPRKVFEYFFEGQRPGRGRENIVKLEVRWHYSLAGWW